MQSKTNTKKIIEILHKKYGEVNPFLNHKNDFEFLIAVILSAQTTDAMVNKVTPDLFEKYPTPKSLSEAQVEDVERIIRRVNYYKSKARNIVKTAAKIRKDFRGKVPHSMTDLLTLPGVGRKVANVIMADFHKNPEGIVVDTHVKRVSYRIGWTNHTDPKKVEIDLIKKWPKQAYFETPKHLILIGRNYCFANKKPDCENCPLMGICQKKF
jgi:endonuclease-3